MGCSDLLIAATMMLRVGFETRSRRRVANAPKLDQMSIVHLNHQPLVPISPFAEASMP
jgi:hypothetical protein